MVNLNVHVPKLLIDFRGLFMSIQLILLVVLFDFLHFLFVLLLLLFPQSGISLQNSLLALFDF